MPHDPEAFADMVIMIVKSALAPVLERVASSEQMNRDLLARVLELSGLRDRVTVIETKATMVPALSVLSSERTAVESAPILASLSELTKDFGLMRERVAVVETRAQIPGPPGKDGQPGKDGADGVGWDDLAVVQDDERSFTIKAARGERVKVLGTARFPVQIQQGVYVDGQTYVRGDVATFGGSQWHCDAETTATKPGESKDWTLIVKRGRDGKDGKDAPQTLPVVAR